MDILLILVVTFGVAVAGENDPVNLRKSVGCVTSEFQSGPAYNTTLVWDFKGMTKLLDFSPTEKAKLDVSIPINDPEFPARGSLKILFGRIQSNHLGFFAKLESERNLNYKMELHIIVGQKTITEPQSSKAWLPAEFYRQYLSRLQDDDDAHPTDPALQNNKKLSPEALNRWTLENANATYVGFIPGISYHNFQKFKAKDPSSSQVQDVTLVIQLFAVETLNVTVSSSSPCSLPVDYKPAVQAPPQRKNA